MTQQQKPDRNLLMYFYTDVFNSLWLKNSWEPLTTGMGVL